MSDQSGSSAKKHEEKTVTRHSEISPNQVKVPLKPGFGLSNWMSIVRKGKNVSGISPSRGVTFAMRSSLYCEKLRKRSEFASLRFAEN
ncbi:unnamed protein product [Oikopleura dioica]|uniref:Uncharacterized protein n=1 Tax=Oikopleura dioica TaxID=34765 RepID=E4YXN4_OIKDI|nr:unnamed protein product [Oikopleura dioica]